MAEAIRELRQQRKIPSKDLASALGRSASYISKIEGGSYKSISVEEFEKILELILPDCSSTQERLDKLLDYQLKKHGLSMSEEKAWYMNLDTVHRIIPVPFSLVQEIKSTLLEHNITVEALVARINGNEELSLFDLNDPDLPVNEWFERADESSKMSIKMHLALEDVISLLEGQTISSNYVTIQAIVHYMIKMTDYPANHEFSNDDLRSVCNKCVKILDKHKFYTVSRKQELLESAQSQKEANSILNEFDIENKEAINNLLGFLKVASDMNVVFTTRVLKQLIANLQWDHNFILTLIGFDFACINQCSHANKSNLLREIRELILKYKDMPDEEKRSETYDDFD